MTVFEMVKMNQFMLDMLVQNGGRARDVKHIELYKEYLRMNKEGHKLMYIVTFLSEEYGVSEATVYRVINRFSKEVEM